MRFTSFMQVPNTKNARLLNLLILNEHKLAEISGYNVKLIEMSGITSSRLFQRVPGRTACHWDTCPVCLVPDQDKKERNTVCRKSNVVYKATCVLCEEQVADGSREDTDIGIYVGESSRTLVERASEHMAGANLLKEDNFVVKHWVNDHQDQLSPPVM